MMSTDPADTRWLEVLARAGYDLARIPHPREREWIARHAPSRGIRLGPGPTLLADGSETA